MALNLARNSRVFVSTQLTSGFTSLNTWEILVQDGFSFSQGIGTQDITVNEAGDTPTRGSQTFNTQLDPAEWSFSAYVRSYIDNDGNHQSPEGVLWAAIASGTTPDFNDSVNSVTGSPTSFDVDFSDSERHELLKLNIFFLVDNVWYVVKDAQVNQAEVDFSIDGISMITWSGQGTEVAETTTHPDITTANIELGTNPKLVAFADRGDITADGNTVVASNYLAVPLDATYIKNKLSTLALIPEAGQDPGDPTYAIAITGGSLTINNNITYVTPETLSIVDKPIGSFTGSRQVSGSFTCYLDTKANGSSTLIKNLSQNFNTTNRYALTLNMGGPLTPRTVFSMPTTQVSVPTLDVQDVLGINVDFAAQGSAGLNSTDELVVKYYSQV